MEIGKVAMEPEIGQVWAYRARGVDPLTPVRVLRHGSQRPARVLVKFEDEAGEGREDWVPPARLKVLWTNVAAFNAEEARWTAVQDLSPGRESAEAMAAEPVFDLVVPTEVARMWSSDGVVAFRDTAALAVLSGMSIEDLTGHETSFEHDGAVIAPWPITLALAQALAKRLAREVLLEAEKEEQKVQDELINGFSFKRSGGHRDLDQEIAIAREVDERGYRQSRELRRQWCGAEATGRWDELRELRKEIRRVDAVAEEAIATLRRRGHATDADRLALSLGQKVEMLQTEVS